MQNVLEKQKRCMKIVNIKINGKKQLIFGFCMTKTQIKMEKRDWHTGDRIRHRLWLSLHLDSGRSYFRKNKSAKIMNNPLSNKLFR